MPSNVLTCYWKCQFSTPENQLCFQRMTGILNFDCIFSAFFEDVGDGNWNAQQTQTTLHGNYQQLFAPWWRINTPKPVQSHRHRKLHVVIAGFTFFPTLTLNLIILIVCCSSHCIWPNILYGLLFSDSRDSMSNNYFCYVLQIAGKTFCFWHVRR